MFLRFRISDKSNFQLFLSQQVNRKEVTYHAEVLPVFVFADDVSHTGESGTRVFVDGDLIIQFDRVTLT